MQARKPDDATLAFLLGLALGVMLTLSVVELWVKNALEHGWVAISVATLAGAALYYFAQPFSPSLRCVLSECRLTSVLTNQGSLSRADQ